MIVTIIFYVISAIGLLLGCFISSTNEGNTPERRDHLDWVSLSYFAVSALFAIAGGVA